VVVCAPSVVTVSESGVCERAPSRAGSLAESVEEELPPGSLTQLLDVVGLSGGDSSPQTPEATPLLRAAPSPPRTPQRRRRSFTERLLPLKHSQEEGFWADVFSGVKTLSLAIFGAGVFPIPYAFRILGPGAHAAGRAHRGRASCACEDAHLGPFVCER